MNRSNFSCWSKLLVFLPKLFVLLFSSYVVCYFSLCWGYLAWLPGVRGGLGPKSPLCFTKFPFSVSSYFWDGTKHEVLYWKISSILLSTCIPFLSSLIWHVNFLAVAHLVLPNLLPTVQMLLIKSGKYDAKPSLWILAGI